MTYILTITITLMLPGIGARTADIDIPKPYVSLEECQSKAGQMTAAPDLNNDTMRVSKAVCSGRS